jgi:ABC-2 type transport system permease protein
MNDLVRSELVKLRTTFSFRMTVLLVLIAAPVIAVVNTFTAGMNGQPTLDTWAGVHHALGTSVYLSMAMLGLGIVSVASEYRFGTIVPTLLAEPRRRRVLFAKTAALAGVGAVVGAVGFGLTAAVSMPALAFHGVHGLPSDVPQMLAGATVGGAMFAAIGVALGEITRNTVAAVVGAIVWISLIETTVLHAAVPWLAKWLPSGAAMALDRSAAGTGPLLNPVVATVVLLGYAAALTVVAARYAQTRDSL